MFVGQFVNELADGQIKHSQAERAEEQNALFVSPWRCLPEENVCERAADEVAPAG